MLTNIFVYAHTHTRAWTKIMQGYISTYRVRKKKVYYQLQRKSEKKGEGGGDQLLYFMACKTLP